MQTIKIFLGSSIDELHDERLLLGDYLLNSVRPIFKRDGVDIEVVKCEDIQTGYRGKSSQEEIDDLLRGCDISVFMFKTKAGPTTVHEYKVAQELVGTKKHEIYVYCFGVTEEEKEESLKGFKQQMRDIELYWKTCKDINDLEKQFIIGLLILERRLLGLTKPSAVEQESKTEQNGDARFAKYQQNEQAQAQLREEIHKDIDDLLQQTETVMANEDETIAVRIFKVIELYKKADQWAATTDYDKEKYSDLLSDYACFLYEYGLYRDAVAVFLRQITIAEELYGKEHENTAKSYNNIGAVYYAQGIYGKALEYYKKALVIMERNLGMEQPDTAKSYINIGLVYKRQGNYNKALKHYSKARTILEKVLGTNNPDTAALYTNIGAVYDDKGNYPEALKYYFKAMEIMEKLLGKKHPNTATSYNNIGLVYKKQGNYNKALEYYMKALTIWVKDRGTNHPSTATSYDNIGAVYYEKGDYGKALKYCQKALAIREKTLGMEHPCTATSYNNIGGVYKKQGDPAKALEYYTKAYRILKKKLGNDHPHTKSVSRSINDMIKALSPND